MQNIWNLRLIEEEGRDGDFREVKCDSLFLSLSLWLALTLLKYQICFSDIFNNAGQTVQQLPFTHLFNV